MKLFILDAIIFLKMVGNYFFVPENMKSKFFSKEQGFLKLFSLNEIHQKQRQKLIFYFLWQIVAKFSFIF